MNPLVYQWEEQLNSLFKGKTTQKVTHGIAFGLDEFTVVHSYVNTPKTTPSGMQIPSKYVSIESFDEVPEKIKDSSNFLFKGESDKIYLLNFILVAKKENRSFLIYNGEIKSCTQKLIPVQSDLYSRSKGLLETDSLSKKSVGIVGLGSGGSPVAVELAKAGIGNFVLVDFDRLELSNVSRHVCGINDLGRLKTFAVRDSILQKNPYAKVETLEIDVNKHRDQCMDALSKVDLIICASDNDQSRFFINEIALKYKIAAIFGRAITRATGGDVLRVRPYQGPCYSCLYSLNIRQDGGDDEEVSQENQAKKLLPDYTSEQEIKTVVQVGLSSDIAPISNFMVKLALVELSKGLDSGIKSLEDDLVSDFYIWANRRENVYESWNKLEFNFVKPSILRWYGARVPKDPNCMVCGI